MKKEIALIGNPNCGKTSLFNVITGLNAKVGNFAGVTTERREGYYKKNKSAVFVDLPGIYDFNVQSLDEKVVVDYVKTHNISAIINVVDGLNLERNLFLTLKLTALKIPIVLAVNFCDQLKKKNIKIDTDYLEKTFNVKVVLVSALKNVNIERLVTLALNISGTPKDFSKEYLDPKSAYDFIEGVVNKSLTKGQEKEGKMKAFLDKLFFSKLLALPIFILVLTAIFYLSSVIGTFFEQGADKLFNLLLSRISIDGTSSFNIFINFLVNGVLKGAFTVISFLPHVLTLFFFLSLMEDSGYMSRVAFMLDGLLKRFNISGKSVIPFVLCSGCTVNGIMGSRIIEDRVERKKCIALSPIVPCGAKSAVFSYFAGLFFNGSPFISVSLYMLSIVFIIIFAKLFNKKASCSACSFIMEIPPLRVPYAKNITAVLMEKVKDFFCRVAPLIVVSSIIMFTLLNFGFCGYTHGDIEKSFLYYLGSALKYLFVPLGFSNWQTAVALIVGFFAKEGIIGALEIVGVNGLFQNAISAYGFLVFIMLSPPCIASLVTIKKELNNKKEFASVILFQILTAYLASLTINLIGVILFCEKHLHFIILICIMLLSLIMFLILRFIKKSKGEHNENHVRLYAYGRRYGRRRNVSRRLEKR